MLFTSSQFIAFMAVVLLAYYLVPKKAQWPLLLVASYIFYWCASPWYLLFIGVTIILLVIIGLSVIINCYKVANSNPVKYLKDE